MQATMASANSHRHAEVRQGKSQKGGKLWEDENFLHLKLDHYCTGSTLEQIKPSATRGFRAWKEKWEMVQFSYKGGQQHQTRFVVKYGGLQYADVDKDNIIGTLSHDCPLVYKMPDNRQRTKGLGYKYILLAVNEILIQCWIMQIRQRNWQSCERGMHGRGMQIFMTS